MHSLVDYYDYRFQWSLSVVEEDNNFDKDHTEMRAAFEVLSRVLLVIIVERN